MKYVEIRLKYIEKVYVTEGSAEIHRKNTKLGGYHFDRSKKFGKKIWKSFSRRSPGLSD
jgi:hypothetical protein